MDRPGIGLWNAMLKVGHCRTSRACHAIVIFRDGCASRTRPHHPSAASSTRRRAHDDPATDFFASLSLSAILPHPHARALASPDSSRSRHLQLHAAAVPAWLYFATLYLRSRPPRNFLYKSRTVYSVTEYSWHMSLVYPDCMIACLATNTSILAGRGPTCQGFRSLQGPSSSS